MLLFLIWSSVTPLLLSRLPTPAGSVSTSPFNYLFVCFVEKGSAGPVWRSRESLQDSVFSFTMWSWGSNSVFVVSAHTHELSCWPSTLHFWDQVFHWTWRALFHLIGWPVSLQKPPTLPLRARLTGPLVLSPQGQVDKSSSPSPQGQSYRSSSPSPLGQSYRSSCTFYC